MIRLTLKQPLEMALEASVVTPDGFLGKSADEVARLPVAYGKQGACLGDFFTVQGDGAAEVQLEGDLARVKSLGAGMTQGSLTVYGDVGMHLGAGMRGGEIAVHGNAGAWAGVEMSGGRLHIHGNAGHGLGGAYRGSRRGMNRGVVIVDGNAGNETGAVMRRGLIVVLGDAGDFTGAFMIAGTILVFGQMGLNAGDRLLRGTIVTYHEAHLLPTYRYDCRYRPSFLDLIFNSLQAHGVALDAGRWSGSYRRYSGDFNTLGKGEILVYNEP